MLFSAWGNEDVRCKEEVYFGMAVVHDQVTLCWESFVGCWASECRKVDGLEMGMRHGEA